MRRRRGNLLDRRILAVVSLKEKGGLFARVDPYHLFAAHNSVFLADTEIPGGRAIQGYVANIGSCPRGDGVLHVSICAMSSFCPCRHEASGFHRSIGVCGERQPASRKAEPTDRGGHPISSCRSGHAAPLQATAGKNHRQEAHAPQSPRARLGHGRAVDLDQGRCARTCVHGPDSLPRVDAVLGSVPVPSTVVDKV